MISFCLLPYTGLVCISMLVAAAVVFLFREATSHSTGDRSLRAMSCLRACPGLAWPRPAFAKPQLACAPLQKNVHLARIELATFSV